MKFIPEIDGILTFVTCSREKARQNLARKGCFATSTETVPWINTIIVSFEREGIQLPYGCSFALLHHQIRTQHASEKSKMHLVIGFLSHMVGGIAVILVEVVCHVHSVAKWFRFVGGVFFSFFSCQNFDIT